MIMGNDQIVIYQTDDGQTQIDVLLENDLIWLTRQQIAALFGRDYKTISKHINNALKEELAGSVVVAKFANTTQHGAIEGKTQTHEIDYFNLEVITFLWFLNNNGILYRADGSKRLSDNTLVALTLMIAESRTEEKDVMVKVVVNLINQNN